MSELSISGLIEETRALWNQGKKVMIQVAWNLKRIQDSGEWSGHDTFPEFCEKELDIKQSQTSKLLTIANYFLGEYTPEQIGPVDYERLYNAARLPGTVAENLSRAKTWNRADFKEHKAEIDPHAPEWIKYCKICELGELKHPIFNGTEANHG